MKRASVDILEKLQSKPKRGQPAILQPFYQSHSWLFPFCWLSINRTKDVINNRSFFGCLLSITLGIFINRTLRCSTDRALVKHVFSQQCKVNQTKLRMNEVGWRERLEEIMIFSRLVMGGSSSSWGYPNSWLVYIEQSIYKWMTWGTPKKMDWFQGLRKPSIDWV